MSGTWEGKWDTSRFFALENKHVTTKQAKFGSYPSIQDTGVLELISGTLTGQEGEECQGLHLPLSVFELHEK